MHCILFHIRKILQFKLTVYLRKREMRKFVYFCSFCLYSKDVKNSILTRTVGDYTVLILNGKTIPNNLR